jgi:hypothetical protein
VFPFGSLWKAIMLEDCLVVDGNRWSLSSSVFWTESTTQLIVREQWITYRDLILSSYPHCVKLTGKSGRGKSVFLRYLMFYILLKAKQLGNDVGSTAAEHLTDPRIAFMDRDKVLYHITKDKITSHSAVGGSWSLWLDVHTTTSPTMRTSTMRVLVHL